MTARPICIIKYNPEALGIGSNYNIADVNDIFERRFPDYLTFAYPVHSIGPNFESYSDAFSFQVFYEKDFTHAQYGDLRQQIQTAIENLRGRS